MSDAMASQMRNQLTSTIILFAPSERDVYSYEQTPKYLAPLGAKPSRSGEAEAIALLRSSGLKQESSGYEHLAPQGRSHKQCSCTSNLNSQMKCELRNRLYLRSS